MPVRYSIRNQYVNSFVKRFFSSKPIVPDLDRQFLRFIRNFGFFAHIDAGKTTISEAVLFNGNEIKTRYVLVCILIFLEVVWTKVLQ